MSNNGKFVIPIDATDWRDEVMHNEMVIEKEEDIVDAIAKGKQTAEVARAVIVNRELGHAPSDIIRPNRILLMTGAQADIADLFHSKTMAEFTARNGKTYAVPGFIGKGKQETPDADEKADGVELEASYVEIQSDDGIERNRHYLSKTVTGWIWNRFGQLKAAGADVRQAADELKAAVDEMVEKIEG